jgi:HK97 family phage major capsid protein
MDMELKDVLDQLGMAFEEYRKTNDARLEELRKTGHNSAELEEKLARIDGELKRLDEEKAKLEAKLNRPGLVNGNEDPVKAEHKSAFLRWMRKGVEEGLADLQFKAIQTGVDGDGGYAVPELLNREVYSLLQKATPMRNVCRVITVGAGEYKELVNKHGATSGWVGETDARAATNSPSLAELTPFMGEIYAYPQATQRALDDMFFDVEAWLAAELSDAFTTAENAAFTTGNGTNKPKGFLAYTTALTADGTRAFGSLQYLRTGVAAGLPTTNPGDLLIDVVHTLKAGHRANARWMMNSLTLAQVRKWKDNENNYLWQPGLQAGVPSALLGYPVTENEDMPDVAADGYPIAFGDFRAGYTIVDRIGIRMLRDPYTNKPYVGFYSTMRVGGFLKDSEAIKLVKCEAA